MTKPFMPFWNQSFIETRLGTIKIVLKLHKEKKSLGEIREIFPEISRQTAHHIIKSNL